MRTMLPLALCLLVTPALAQDRPLPDYSAFVAEVRKHLQTDEERQSGYVYQETRRDVQLDKHGKVTKEEVRVYESYPGLPDQPRWRRLISKNGVPLPAAELDKQDRERQKKAQEYIRKLERETDKDRRTRAQEREKDRRESERAIDDAFLVYDFAMLGREVIDGHATIKFSMTPRPQSKPKTREGKIMKKFTGTAWISETDYELVRLEVEAIDTVTFGLGVVARIHEGSELAFERRKVNGEVWLPASANYTVSGRLALVKRIRSGAVSEFSNYRKFTVDTDTAISKPKQ
ncbi:MAG: hypothetical protein AB1635_01255 [Acidobacteriota bacterium]